VISQPYYKKKQNGWSRRTGRKDQSAVL